MRTPRVSVVMPSYNHAAFVARAIQSVLDQTLDDVELLIGDDGSTDGTPNVIEEFNDPRIRFWRHDRNRGASMVINELIQQSRGRYIAKLSSDDFWPLDKLEYQVEFLDGHSEYAAIFGNAFFVDQYDAPIPFDMYDFAQPNRSSGAWLRRFFEQGNCLCYPTLLIRRECYDILGGYDNRLRQLLDFDMWVRLVKHYSLYVSDRVLVYFRILPGLNASAPTVENQLRDSTENFLIAHRLFDGVDRQLLLEGFADLLVWPELPTQLHAEIEKTLLLFRRQDYLAAAYRAVGIHKLEAQLASLPHRRVLELDYGFDDLAFQRLTAAVDTFLVAYQGGAASSPMGDLLPTPGSGSHSH